MRILIVTTEFPPYSGGVATFAEAAANGLTALGEDIAVLAPRYGSNDCEYDNKVPFAVQRVDIAGSGRRLRRTIVNRFASQPPDCLLLANGKATRYLAPLGKLPIPVAIYLHGSEIPRQFDEQSTLHNSTRSEIAEFYRHSDCVMANSSSTVSLFDRYQMLHSKTAELVHLGIDLSRLPTASSADRDLARRTYDGERIILCTSRLSEGKGHDVLLPAFRDVVNRFPAARLHLAGDGPCRSELEAMAASLELDKSVRFLGNLPPNELAVQYDLCELFTMVSRRGTDESFGLVFLEANAFGKPVVAGRTGGVADAVEDGVSGLLVDPCDRQEIANALSSLLQDRAKAEAMGERGRERVLKYFTHLRMAEQMRQLLRSHSRQPSRHKIIRWQLYQSATACLRTALQAARRTRN